MEDSPTARNEGFNVLGIGAAACVACCAPLLLSFLGGLGLASTFWFGSVGLMLAAVAMAGLVTLRRRRRHTAAACATDGSCACD